MFWEKATARLAWKWLEYLALCVVLVSPYSVQELPSPNCTRHYLLVAGNSQACSKSLEKRRNSFEPHCYGLFSVDSEYVRQYQQFGTIYLLVKHFGQGLVPSRHLRDWCSIYAVPVSPFCHFGQVMLEIFVWRILSTSSSKALYCKICIWVLRFVQSYWWINFSHVKRRCYTSFINNF